MARTHTYYYIIEDEFPNGDPGINFKLKSLKDVKMWLKYSGCPTYNLCIYKISKNKMKLIYRDEYCVGVTYNKIF